jgi:hypothetical protein
MICPRCLKPMILTRAADDFFRWVCSKCRWFELTWTTSKEEVLRAENVVPKSKNVGDGFIDACGRQWEGIKAQEDER